MRRWVPILLLLAACRPEGDGGEGIRAGLDRAFPREHVARIRLQVDGGWGVMEEAYVFDGITEYRAASLAWDGERLDPVGLRIRGPVEDGHGRSSPKQDLRIDFNTFGGSRFHGVDRVNLQGDFDDPSLMRRLLASRMYRAMGVPAGRAALAVVELDGEELGVYTLLQPLDGRFLRAEFGRRDGADDGTLYGCAPPFCHLFDAGDAKDDYRIPDCGGGEPCGWVLETHETDPARNGYGDLVTFIQWINTATDEEFAAGIEDRFDVDGFLRFLAVAAAIGDYDGYLKSYEDFSLYHRPDTDRWVFLPVDHDRSYGDGSCKGSLEPTGGPVLPPWCGWETRPLGDRILAVGAYEDAYLGYIEEVATEWLTVEVHRAWIDELEALLRGPLAADPSFPFTPVVHEASLGSAVSDWEPPNLLEFVEARQARLLEEVSR
ncbi:MAG: CotH kinase family protein [Pseudomonadota bacterium]